MHIFWFNQRYLIDRSLHHAGRYAEAYELGKEAMNIFDGNQKANNFVEKIRQRVC